MEWLQRNREKFLSDWYNFNVPVFFLLLCFLYIALLLLKRLFIIDSIAAFEILQERGEFWVFDILFGLQYLSVPFFLAWKFLFTTFLLWMGCFMFGYRLTFAQLWKWVMFAEVIFLVPEALKVVWFTAFVSEASFEQYRAFYPFSLMNFFDYQTLPGRWHYPLKSLNIFEIFYSFSLIAGIYILSGKKISISTYVVLSSYVLGMVIWLIFYPLVYG